MQRWSIKVGITIRVSSIIIENVNINFIRTGLYYELEVCSNLISLWLNIIVSLSSLSKKFIHFLIDKIGSQWRVAHITSTDYGIFQNKLMKNKVNLKKYSIS